MTPLTWIGVASSSFAFLVAGSAFLEPEDCLVAQASKSASPVHLNIVETAAKAGSFKTLVTAVKAAGLADALSQPGPFTVFAPTDEAFAKLPASTLADLLKPENKGTLAAILTYHVVAGEVPSTKAVKLTSADTLNGQRIQLAVKNDSLMIDAARVVKADIECSNGMIHVIDSVILPTTDTLAVVAEKAGSFTTLLAAAKAAGLVDALTGKDPLTVLAPTDEAFAKLPPGTVESLLKPENRAKLASILKYHIIADRVFSDQALRASKARTLQGGTVEFAEHDDGVRVNGANVIAADIDASNGVIHVIDAVLLPATN